MTREDLEKYLHLKAEAEQLKEEVNKLKASLESPRSIVIDGMPRTLLPQLRREDGRSGRWI